MTDINNIIGKKGGSSAPYIPVEAPNTARSTTTGRVLDLLCEGEIEGPANDNNWYKSTYYNETQVMSDAGDMQFEGVTIDARTGTPSQSYIAGFPSIETTVNVNTQVTHDGGAISRTITDTDVDNVRIVIYIPRLMQQNDNGDIVGTTVKLHVTVTPNNGAGTEQIAISSSTATITEKFIAPYERQYIIKDISQYGSGPWVIKVYRDTADSSSSKLANDTYWYNYTEVIHERLSYPDSVVVGTTFDAKLFGNQVPKRAYKIKGMKIRYPSNYTPSTRTYDGEWDGTFLTGYCNNPAWVTYDMLTNTRYGIGIDDEYVDKWALYTIGKYCDEDVTYTQKVRQADGSYTSTDYTEPRFSFNGVIQSRTEAVYVVQHLCSVFRGFPLWATGLATFVQDSPADTTRVASQANVIDGLFNYEGAPKRQRHTAAKVSYNNPDDFGRLAVELVEDEAGIAQYGYNPIDITAYGCTSRTEAIRRAKYILDTDINGTESVIFKGGLEWADCLPGEVISVQDEHYADMRFSGRIVSATNTSITIDKEINIESGETYTLLLQQNKNNIKELTLTNSPGTTSTLTWTDVLTDIPQPGNVWSVSATNLANRLFRVVQNLEKDKATYEIHAVTYDPNKYARIENGIIVEPLPVSDTQNTKLDPPTNLTYEQYSYTDGDQANRKYGLLVSWENSTDPRADYYQVRGRTSVTSWITLGETGNNYYDIRPLPENITGQINIGVRAAGAGGYSNWVETGMFDLITAASGIAPPSDVRVLGGGSTFNGPDCHITWSGSTGGYYRGESIGDDVVAYYKIEVRKPDTTLLRTAYTASKEDTNYIYTHEMNTDDNGGTPIRSILFQVYTIDIYGDPSSNYAGLTASNPAPDMSSSTPTVTPKYGSLKVEWTTVNDNDMNYYKIYADTNNPPTTEVGTLTHPGHIFTIDNLDYGTDYYVQIEPYDFFGAGTKSQIPAAMSPIQIPSINVDAEVENSITMTDSDSNSSSTLAVLYNKTYAASGVEYVLSGTDKYIQYAYNINNYFDRIGIWTNNANGKVYVAYSNDSGDTWDYLKAEADHTPDANNSLLVASSQSDARTNYLQLATGKNIVLFPDNIVANTIRLYMTGSYTTTIYELIPSRLIISELAAIESLSAISADIGTIQAGNLQSTNYSSSDGMNFDLAGKGDIIIGGTASPKLHFDGDANTLNISAVTTFLSGSSGYTNISDKPTQLANINYTEGNKLSGIENGADVTSNHTANDTNNVNSLPSSHVSGWAHATDSTKIDGGKIYTGTVTATQIYTDNLSSLSANVGTVTAGLVQSTDWGTAAGTQLDLTNGTVKFGGSTSPKLYWDGSTLTIVGQLTITGGNGISNLTDAGSLATQDSVDWSTDVTGTGKPANNADVTANNTAADTSAVNGLAASHVSGWAHPSDTTKINGGNIYANTITATQLIKTSAIITDAAQIQDAIITGAKIGDATITSANIGSAAITSAKIGSGAVTNAKIGSAAITDAKIGNAEVKTLKINGRAVTQPVSAYTAGSTSVTGGTWVSVQTLSATINYGPTIVWFSTHAYMEGLNVRRYVKARLRQGSTTIWESGEIYNTSHTNYLGSDDYPINELFSGTIKTSSTGNLTFYLQLYFQETGSATRTATYRTLIAMEAKR